MNTTLNEIRSHKPCAPSWELLLRGLNKTLPDDEPLAYSTILKICGPADCLWAIAHCHQNGPKICAEFSFWCAKSVLHLMKDSTLITALDVMRRYLDGQTTLEQFEIARTATATACGSAVDESSQAAAYAIRTVNCKANWMATWAAACLGAREAAYAEAGTADCVADWAANWQVAREAQNHKLIELTETIFA